jgi:beta-lactamase regulating signal transducer with metallopeptidase domain
VFFFQPLFRVAARDIQFAAEEQCDAWAANQLDDRFAMATCLTEVASWVLARDRRMPAPCMGRHRSQLAMRVHRLTDSDQAIGAPSRSWRTISSLAVVVVGSLLAPAVTSADANAGQEEHSRPTTESHHNREHGDRESARDEHGARERRREHRSSESEREHR